MRPKVFTQRFPVRERALIVSTFVGSFLLLCLACSSESTSNASDASANTDAAAIDAATDDVTTDGQTITDAAVDKASMCASAFGAALTAPYGRLDGTVVALVPPAHPTCAMPNKDHSVLQILWGGSVYRMVINLQSSFGDPNVRFAEISAPLKGSSFSEGWHTDVTLDYVTDLGLHNDGTRLKPFPMVDLAKEIESRIEVSAEVSVFATSTGGASAHLIHRNKPGMDGAIVLEPKSKTPRTLVFAFADQTF